METQDQYDIIIAGGGLAGLTLALQLKQAKSDLSILILEKRKGAAPVAIHKVGEATSELGSHYLREIIGLKEYLTEFQLPKYGFRFFFSPQHKDDISRRIEVGSRISNPQSTHQIDRGVFENDLTEMVRKQNIDIVQGADVEDIEISREGHTIEYQIDSNHFIRHAKWIVDASGRRSLLKRKLGLIKESDHDANAVWFRVNVNIDIDDWSDNTDWNKKFDPGRRRMATNHLMGEGYWVWIIPLVSSSTSIGIVADPSFHSLHDINSSEKAFAWLEKFEPVAARMLSPHKEEIMDFKVMKHFAHDTTQFYSKDRWGVTGDAGAFLDAFYSPGTDFIALGNSWLTELIIRDLNKEDISLRTMIYEHAHRELFNGWMLLYNNMYEIFGNTQVMMMKVVWDWGSYWGIPCMMFLNGGYTNIEILKQYSASANSIGKRFSTLNKKIQELFRIWAAHSDKPCADKFVNVFDLDCLRDFHLDLSNRYDASDLINVIESNLRVIERIYAEIFRVASAEINGTPEDMNVDPYQMHINDGIVVLLEKSNSPDALILNESMQKDIATVTFIPVYENENAYVR